MFRSILALVLLSACSSAGTKSLPDAGAPDAGLRCGVPTPPTCAATAMLNQNFAVDASGNYRITFRWDGEDAVDVDLEDYH